MKKVFTLLIALLLAITGSWAQTSNYFNGFESGISPGWDAFGGVYNPTRVASGTSSITSASGSWHAEAGLSATNFGGYNSVFPALGYKTSLDIYLNVNGGYINDKKVDYTSAINKPDGNHLRDFIFNGGFYNDATPVGTSLTNRFIFSASNNSGTSAWPANPARNPIAISESGWYTFEHYFYNSGGGVLAVDLKIYNSSDVLMGSWTLSDPTDIIGSTVGGNRYGWIATNQLGTLAIDNSSLTLITPPSIITSIGSPTPSACGTLDVPVTVKNFNDVGAVSLILNYTTTQLAFQSIDLTAIPGAAVNTATPGKIIISKYPDPAITLTDDAELIKLHFTILPAAASGTITNLVWDDAPNTGNCEYAGPGGDPVYESTFNDASVTIPVRPVKNTTTLREYCTIQAAINDAATLATHTLEVDAALYSASEQVLVNKEVIIKGVNGKPIVKFLGTVTGKPALFDVSKPNVTIENFEMHVDLVKLSSAIIATSTDMDNITIKSNDIKAIGSSSAASTSYSLRNAVSINYAGYRVFSGGVDNIIFQNNTVSGVADDGFGVARFFRSGISVDEGSGSFTGNTLQTINHDILVRFANGGAVTVTGNNLNGGGMEFADFNAGAGTLTINGNQFNGAVANAYSNALRLKNNYTARPTVVSGNTFTGFEGNVTGYGGTLSLENYQAVTIDNNTFTPLANSTVYRHITLNTKEFSSASGFYAPVVGAIFTNNVFNGSGTPGGTALAFYNWDNDAPVFNAITIGTAGNENTFNDGIAKFILLDGSTGTVAPNGTTMVPWAINLDAQNNKFATSTPTLPSAMTLAQLFALEDKIDHKIDNQSLGFVTVKASNAYVTDIAAPAANNNDYTRIRNAVELVANNWTINLHGTFDWVETNAAASWALGNDGVSGNDDDYTVLVPANLTGVTFTAPEGLGNATIQGPGDLPGANLEGTLNFWLGNNQDWTISNMKIFDFDLGIGMWFKNTTDFNNLLVTNNHIRIPKDLNTTVAPADVNQNIGIHYAFGTNQTFSNNIFDVEGDGVSDGTKYSVSVVMQSNTSGGAVYDGLKIKDNTITVTGVPDATNPAVIRGIWENGANSNAAIEISGNLFTNANVANTANLNRQVAFWITSVSSASKKVEYKNNEVSGFNEGIAWIGGLYTSWTPPAFNTGQMPVEIMNNKFDAMMNAVVVRKAAASTNPGSPALVNENSFTNLVSGGLAIKNEGTGDALANCNWYGTTVPSLIATQISGTVIYAPWLVSGVDASADRGFQPSVECAECAIELAATDVDVSCPGSADGSIDLTVTGAITPVTYSWIGPGTFTSDLEDLTGLVAGDYTVTVTGTNGCTATKTVTVGTVPDVTPPSATGALQTLTVDGCSAGDAPLAKTTVAELEAMGVAITENCTPEVDMTVTSADASTGSCPIVVTRTYTVKDGSLNELVLVQTINVRDITAPVLTVPADLTVDCDDPKDPANTGGSATAVDDCNGPVTPTYSDIPSQLIPSTWPGGTAIQGRARWGRNGFEAALYLGGTVGPNLNPAGTPVWVIGTPYKFEYYYDVTSGDHTLKIDFNNDLTYGAGEVITQATSYAGKSFKHFSIFMSGDATRGITLNNFVVNGVNLGNFVSPSSGALEPDWENSDGYFGNILATGTITFTGTGVPYGGDETGRIWFRTAEPVTIPDAPAVTCAGNYVINRVWTAEDACENKSIKVQKITVQDVTPPVLTGQGANATIYCPAEPVFTVPTAADACDAAPAIAFVDVTTPSGATEAPYSVTRTWTATDACGNVSLPVSQTISVEKASISGKLVYNNTAQTPMGNVTLGLYDALTNTQIGVDVVTSVDDATIGAYAFSNLCAGTYIIRVKANAKPVGYINATDAAQVNAWVNDPIEHVKFLAGDVNSNNLINSTDANAIQNYFVNGITFTRVWSYWKQGATINSNSDPYSIIPADNAPWPADITVEVSGNVTDFDLFGMGTGDFNGSFTPMLKSANASLTLAENSNLQVGASQAFELPLRAAYAMQVGAVSMILDVPSELVTVKNVKINGSTTPVSWAIKGNELRIGWHSLNPVNVAENGALVTLELMTTNAFAEGQTLDIALPFNPLNELADGNFEAMEYAELMVAKVGNKTVGTIDVDKNGGLLFSNYPNPFTKVTTLEYSLPVDGKVTLSLYNNVGQLVSVLVDADQMAGQHTFRYESNTLQPGIYVAKLRLVNSETDMVGTIKLSVQK